MEGSELVEADVIMEIRDWRELRNGHEPRNAGGLQTLRKVT